MDFYCCIVKYKHKSSVKFCCYHNKQKKNNEENKVNSALPPEVNGLHVKKISPLLL